MEIIEPQVEVEKYNGIKIMKNIERAMRNCYRTEDSITDDSYKRLIAKSINSGHGSVLEHEKITVRMLCDVGCYDDKTEVLTVDGWKKFKDLKVYDKVFTLTDDNKVIESPIRAIISKDYQGDMYHFSNTTLDLMVTSDHNMWVFDENKRSEKTKIWKFLEAKNMTNSIYKFNKIGNKNRTNIQRNIKIPNKQFKNNTNKYGRELNNEFLYELLGWFITDGSLSPNNGKNVSLRIHQKKQKGVQRISYLLAILNIPYTYTKRNTFDIHYTPLAYFFQDICYKNKNDNKKSINAFVPDFVRYAATNEIEAFLKGVYGGDGTIYKDGRKIIYTASEQFAKDLVELLFRIGKTASYYPCPDLSKYSSSFKQNTVTFCVSEYRTEVSYWQKNRKHKNKPNFEKVKYDGKVYCLTLDQYHRIFVMRNGKTAWCGQCYKDLTRHRTGTAFSVESTRYCNYSKGKFGNNLKFIKPIFYTDGEPEEYEDSDMILNCLRTKHWKKTMETIEEEYLEMSKIDGTTPDMLRMILPHSTAAQVVMTCNIREWRHIFTLRCSKAAHPSVRQILIPLLLKFKKDMPELFDDIEYDKDFPEDKYAKVLDLEDTI